MSKHTPGQRIQYACYWWGENCGDSGGHLPGAPSECIDGLLELAEAVAEHFADTDAPLGERARAIIARATTPSPS